MTLRYLESVFGFESKEVPPIVLEKETKINCVQPKGVSYHRLGFYGTGHMCLFSRGPRLNTFPLGIHLAAVGVTTSIRRWSSASFSTVSPNLSIVVAKATLLPLLRGQGSVRLMGDSAGQNQLLLSVLFLLDR